MGVAKSEMSFPDTATNTIEGGIRALVRGNRSTIAGYDDDISAAGATSIADIEKLMKELRLPTYLHSEGERVRRLNARYTHLAQTASASVKIIAESLGKWRNLETINRAHPAVPDEAPVLSRLYGGELPDGSSEQ